MKTKGVVKRYTKEDTTVVWTSELCTHSKKCFAGLPTVFNPKNRPWVQLDEAGVDEIIKQVRACPSGALSIEGDTAKTATATELVKVSVTQAGPLLVTGSFSIVLANGEVEERKGKTALCRCGASANKPYCDGSHNNVEFDG